ncbi:MAG: hydrogenase maturation protease [Candidatus Korarchaeum sp.]
MRTLVICVGNAMRSDDGLGVRVWEELRARGVDAILSGPDMPELLDSLCVDRLVLVDAVDFGGEPGSLISARLEELDPIEIRSSTHSLSPIHFLRLIKEITGHPKEVFVVGVQPKSLDLKEGLSEEVERSLSAVLGRVLEILRDGLEAIQG